MAISFFVSDKQLTPKHAPVKAGEVTLWIRCLVPTTDEELREHPQHAAKKSHDRCMPGEIFLNAIPDSKMEKEHKAAFNWKRGNALAEKMEVPNG